MAKAKFIVFFSTKGGVGKTLLSVNLAVSLRKESSKKVCLVDFDLQASMDMSRMIDLHCAKSLADISAEKELNQDTIPSIFPHIPPALNSCKRPYGRINPRILIKR